MRNILEGLNRPSQRQLKAITRDVDEILNGKTDRPVNLSPTPNQVQTLELSQTQRRIEIRLNNGGENTRRILSREASRLVLTDPDNDKKLTRGDAREISRKLRRGKAVIRGATRLDRRSYIDDL